MKPFRKSKFDIQPDHHDWRNYIVKPYRDEAPPVGLRPRQVVRHQRMIEILDAMNRYVNADKQIPELWILELVQLNKELAK